MRHLRWYLVAFVAIAVNGCSQRGNEPTTLSTNESREAPPVVQSVDGTPIGYAEIGRGRIPLVIVHGVLDTSESWVPVADALSDLCDCFVMDRRGRGRSGDGASYSFEREVEDIEAVLRTAGPNAFLLGHSSGAIYTLEAARRYPLAGLILYEPPLHYQGFEVVVDAMRTLVAEKKLDDAAGLFFTREGGMSESELAAFKDSPAWPQIAQLSPTLVREWDAIFTFEPTVERYTELAMPTLLLAGSETANVATFATADFADSLKNVRTAVLDRQGHTANESAPELVAQHIAAFLRETGQ